MKDSIKILFVEDMKTDAELIWRELEKSEISFSRLLVDNKNDFLEGLKSYNPDLIISDYSLPQFDGMKALRLRNDISPLTPFILVTGSNNEEVAVECMKAGADDYILKDNLTRLGLSVNNSINRANVLKEKDIAEKALHQSEEIFRNFMEHSPIYVFFKDKDIRSIILSNNFETMLGKPITDLLGKNMDELFPSKLAKSMVEDDKRILKDGKAITVNEELNGRFYTTIKFPINIDGKPAYLAGYTIDITEKNQAEDQLKNSYSLLEATFESIHNGILVVSQEGVVIKTNKKFGEMWHIPKEILDSCDDKKLLESILDQLTDPDEFIAKVTELYGKPKAESVDLISFKDGRIFERISKPMFLGNEPKGRVWSFLDITDRKQSEDALRQSELRFKQISENSGEWIWEVDNNGLYTYSSSIVKDILGYEPEEIINKKYFYDLFIPENRDQLKQAAMEAFARKDHFTNLINSNLHKDGSVVILSTSGLPLSNEKGELIGYRGVDTNITAQKLAEETIIHDRRMLRTLIDNLPDMIYVKDHEGKKVIANIADVKSIGFRKEEDIIGKTDLELFSGEAGRRGYANDIDVISTGRPLIENEEDFVNSDGERRWLMTSKYPLFDQNGLITGLVGIGHDITLRKKSEEELNQSYIFNESLLKTIPFGMDIVDEEGTVLFLSENFRKLLGDEAIGKKCWELYRDDKKQCSDCPLFKGIIIGETEIYETHGVLNKRIFEISHTGMMYKGTKAMLEIFQDITDRKLSEEELIKAKEKAEEGDKLKTAFLHNISHEIRTPMNAIVGFSALLGEPGLDAQSQKDYIEVIMQSSNHLLAIITDIIEISNIEANIVKFVKNEINVNSTLKSICDQFLPEITGKNLQLVCENRVPDSAALIITDSTKLKQIISNLLNNAIKFTDQGFIKMGCDVKNKFLEFHVSDSGIGISEEHHNKIFDRFYQVQHSISRLYEGTGLGLAISKANAELMGGEMWLTSEPGIGTTFYFTIPYEKQVKPDALADEKNLLPEYVFPEKKTILIAEDIDSNFKLVRYFLSGVNAEIIRAVNGKEAVEKCLSNKNIDLILMDIKMPVMDGYTAVKLIRETNTSIPIIAQTAYAEDREIAIESGCSGFISKPFDKNGLIRVIQEFI